MISQLEAATESNPKYQTLFRRAREHLSKNKMIAWKHIVPKLMEAGLVISEIDWNSPISSQSIAGAAVGAVAGAAFLPEDRRGWGESVRSSLSDNEKSR